MKVHLEGAPWTETKVEAHIDVRDVALAHIRAAEISSAHVRWSHTWQSSSPVSYQVSSFSQFLKSLFTSPLLWYLSGNLGLQMCR